MCASTTVSSIQCPSRGQQTVSFYICQNVAVKLEVSYKKFTGILFFLFGSATYVSEIFHFLWILWKTQDLCAPRLWIAVFVVFYYTPSLLESVQRKFMVRMLECALKSPDKLP